MDVVDVDHYFYFTEIRITPSNFPLESGKRKTIQFRITPSNFPLESGKRKTAAGGLAV